MSMQHRKLKEEPVPLSIVNPVYDDDISGENQTIGANNNATETKLGQTAKSEDVKVAIPDTHGDSPSVGDATNSTNANFAANETAWSNGKEKLIDSPSTLGGRLLKKPFLIVAIIVMVIIVAVFIAILAYFLSTRSIDTSPTDEPLVGQQKGKDMNYVLGLNGSSQTEGLVVARNKGQKLILCVHSWAVNDGHVLCHQFGHERAVTMTLLNSDGKENSVHILRPPKCLGNETRIDDCPQKLSYRDVGTCVGSTVYLVCGPNSTPKPSTPAAVTVTATTARSPSPSTAQSSTVQSTTTVPSFTPINVKLIGSKNGLPNEGRLLVTDNNIWGSVCRYNWIEENALVVCRQLGYRNYSEFIIRVNVDEVSPAPANMGVWMKNVKCQGNETNLGQCDYQIRDNSEDGCSHTFDVVLECSSDVTTTVAPSDTTTAVVSAEIETSQTITDQTTTSTSPSSTSTTTVTTTTALAVSADAVASLRFGDTPNKGLVVVSMNGIDYTMCDDFWGSEEAAVACRMNGFPQVVAVKDPFQLDHGDDYNTTLFERFPSKVVCEGTETSLSQCSFEDLYTCSHADDVKMICGPEPTTSTTSSTTSTTPLTTTTEPTTDVATTTTETTASASTTTTQVVSTTVGLPENRAIKERTEIRLYNDHGQGSSSGRLEMKYNGTWGTVCGSMWRPESSLVACKQLSFPVADRRLFIERESEGIVHGDEDQPIWVSEVKCLGTEEYLTACQHELADSTCNHDNDVLLSCGENKTELTTAAPEVHDNGYIRLNPGEHKGRLEYWRDGEWGAVCNIGWSSTDALVACRQLGYTNVTAHSVSVYDVDGPTPAYFIAQLSCNGTEDRLADCSYVNNTDAMCYDGWFAYTNVGHRIFLECDPLSKVDSSAYVSDAEDVVRLVHGLNDSNVGMLQYKKNGAWGTLCNEGWTLRDAEVACIQLGFLGVQVYNLSVSEIVGLQASDYSPNFHGKSYQCNSNDDKIEECLNMFSTSCRKRRDEVALVCKPLIAEPALNVTKDDTVRLVGGLTKQEGLVEMKVNDTWGRVCNNSNDWTHADMIFVCVGLFGKPEFATQIPDYLQSMTGNGTFIGGDFNCTATDVYPKLNECQYNSTSSYISQCNDDAIVKCL